jgi:hypothetical protein
MREIKLKRGRPSGKLRTMKEDLWRNRSVERGQGRFLKDGTQCDVGWKERTEVRKERKTENESW